MLAFLFSVLFTLIIGVSIYFYLRKPHLSDEGGIRQRYARIVSLIRENNPNCTEQVTQKTINIRTGGKKEIQKFSFTEVEKKLIIVWSLESSIHGKRGKEFAFNADLTQDEIYNAIATDIENYRHALFRER